jgi:hypothetical protein
MLYLPSTLYITAGGSEIVDCHFYDVLIFNEGYDQTSFDCDVAPLGIKNIVSSQKKGEGGVLWIGFASPQHPTPRFIEKIQNIIYSDPSRSHPVAPA